MRLNQWLAYQLLKALVSCAFLCNLDFNPGAAISKGTGIERICKKYNRIYPALAREYINAENPHIDPGMNLRFSPLKFYGMYYISVWKVQYLRGLKRSHAPDHLINRTIPFSPHPVQYRSRICHHAQT